MPELTFSLPRRPFQKLGALSHRLMTPAIALIAIGISVSAYLIFAHLHLTLAYNDARSHLDIGRRVVEGLKPGLAQLGSVWLPLPHLLMVPTIWNDYMWHTGLAGAIQSMISYVATILLIRAFLKKLGVDLVGQIVGMAIFALNINILYLQSTAMTELLLIGTMMAGCYELLLFHEEGSMLRLVQSAFWIMLSTLIRYDGWFLFFYSAMLVVIFGFRKWGLKGAEGLFVFFCTLAGFGLFLWVLWNTLIFKDPLYFAFGPYSAHAQQDQLATAGVLITKKNWLLSAQTYWYSMAYNTGAITLVIGLFACLVLLLDKKIKVNARLATSVLLAPLLFNILALYLGHSVLFVQGINGDTWFNVRYGIMILPSLAIFWGYLVWRWKALRPLLIGILFFTYFIQFARVDAVTIDDGRVGSSQKNVSEVSSWLSTHAANQKGFVLISAASHDAIIFSSGLPMKKFIHEGTGAYWISATSNPDRWARWIVMRTNDLNDTTFKLVQKSGALGKYQLVKSYPFADIYQIKDQYVSNLNTDPVIKNQK